MYAISTLITEALHLVTQVQLFFDDHYSELMLFTVLANSYWVSVYDAYQYQLYGVCITPLVINSLRHTHTHTHTHTYIDVRTETILRKQACQQQAGVCLV